MFKRVKLFAFVSMLVLGLAGCSGGEEPKQASQPAAAPPPKAEEPKVAVYELTTAEITSHPDWTSRNIAVLGVKIGDKTRDVEKNLGAVENTRTLAEDYLTVYQGNGIFVYTYKNTGKVRRMEIYDTFAKKIADEKLKKLLTSGDLKTMREVLGMEEGSPIENSDDNATEYPYDSRGFRFVKFKVKGKTLNAIRLMDVKKTT